jgi:hypothetical protein
MPGRVKSLIEELIRVRARGRPGLEHFVKAHLVLKGIDPDAYDEKSADEHDKIQVLEQMIRDFKQQR